MRKGGHAWVSPQTTGEHVCEYRICVLRHGRGSDKAETVVNASTFLVFGTQGLTCGLHRRSREVEAARQPGRHRQDPRRQHEQKAAAQGMRMHLCVLLIEDVRAAPRAWMGCRRPPNGAATCAFHDGRVLGPSSLCRPPLPSRRHPRQRQAVKRTAGSTCPTCTPPDCLLRRLLSSCQQRCCVKHGPTKHRGRESLRGAAGTCELVPMPDEQKPPSGSKRKQPCAPS